MLRKVWLYKYRGLSETILASKSRCGPLPFNALENVFDTSSFQTNKTPCDCKGSLMQMALDLRVPVSSPQGEGLDRLDLFPRLILQKPCRIGGREERGL